MIVSNAIDPAVFRNLVLLNASEEAGLFEAIWDLGSKFPESELWQRYRAADAELFIMRSRMVESLAERRRVLAWQIEDLEQERRRGRERER